MVLAATSLALLIATVIGLVYFCVIACSFFITYKVVFRKSEKLEKLFAKIAPLWSKVTSLFGKKKGENAK